jgi:hypothetical protein
MWVRQRTPPAPSIFSASFATKMTRMKIQLSAALTSRCRILWIRDDDAVDVENVIIFVIRLAEDLGLSGLWGFEYSLSCSRPRLDGFGGGAHVIDLSARKSIGWTSTSEWLAIALTGEDPDA